MATKTLKLQIVSELKGSNALATIEKQLKGTKVALTNFTTTTKTSTKGVTTHTHAVSLAAESQRSLNKELNATKVLLASTKSSREVSKKDTRLESAKANSKELLNLTDQTIKLEKLIISKGKKDITVVRERNAQEAVRLKKKLASDLAKIDAGFATGTHGNRVNAQRKAALAAYRKQVLGLHREVDTANKKNIESQRRITEAKKATTRQQGRILKGARSVIRANRSWTLQIAEGIGLYRAISFAINGISRAILAIPKIGIERQTTEAVFEATLGGGAGSAAAFKAISLEAERTGIAIGTLRETFRNLNASMSLAGETTSTVFKVFSNINTVSTALHLTADKTSNVFLALAQIFNKTKVQSEELVKQLGNLLPGAFASFQKANEAQFASSQDLIKAMAAGTVFAHETVENFTAFLADRFSTAFALASVGLQANLGRLSTAFTELGESIFAVTKGPMLSMVKGLTSIVNGLKDAVDGTGLLGVALEQLGTLAITVFTLKALALVKVLLKMGSKTAAVAARFTSLIKVPISVWAIVAAKAIGKLGAAFRFLGGWPAVIILGLAELGGYLVNLGQQAREAAARVEELISVQHRQVLESGLETTISIDVQVEGSEKVKKLKETVEGAIESLRIATERTDFFSLHFNPLGAEKAVSDAKFALAVANQKLENVRTSERDSIILKQKEDQEAELSRRVGADNVLFKQALASQKLSLELADEGTKRQLASLTTSHTLGLTSDAEYYKKKEVLLLKSINSRLTLAKQTEGLADTPLATQKAGLEIAKLESEKARIRQSIAIERKRDSKKTDKGALAYARALSVANLELARMAGNLEEVGRLQISARLDPNIAILLKNGNTELAKQLTIVKDRRIEEARISINLDKQADLLEVNRGKYELIRLSEEEGSRNLEESIDKRISLNKGQRTIQDEQLSLLKEAIKVSDDELGVRMSILDIEEQISIKRQESKDILKDISDSGFEAALGVIGGETVKNVDPSGLLAELGEVAEARANLINDAESSFRDTLSIDKREEFDTTLDNIGLSQEEDSGFSKHEQDMFRLEEMASFKEGLQAKELASFKAHEAEINIISKQSTVSKLNSFGQYALGVADMAANVAMAQTEASIKAYGAESKQAKRAFLEYKAIMIAKTIIATALAVMNIWSTWAALPVVAGALTAVVVALGAVQVSQIAGQQMPAAHGGLDYVPKEETYLLDKGERVLSPNQNKDFTQYLAQGGNTNNNSGQVPNENVNIRVVNTFDDSTFSEYLDSDEGEKIVMNIVKRNA